MATAYVGWYAGDDGTLLGHTAPLRKTPTERRRYFMDFSAVGELEDGDSIDTVTTPPTVTSSPAGVTCSGASLATGNAKRVEVWLSGGTNNEEYWIVFTVTTLAGAVISRRGRLLVTTGDV